MKIKRSAVVRPVWRPIIKKNEKQGQALFDILACQHAVPVDASTRANTYRRARACPECRKAVEQYVLTQPNIGPARAPRKPARAKTSPSRKPARRTSLRSS